MLRDFLQSVQGLESYGIISLILFFVIFAFVIVRVVKMDKSHVKKMSQLPLEKNNENKTSGDHNEIL